MFGAHLSGIALMHSGTGPAAAMSYPLGVHYRVPHGFAGGMFLASVAGANAAAGCHDYADLYDVMDGADRTTSAAARAAAFAERVAAALRPLGVYQSPESLGLHGPAVDRFVADTLELAGALEQNPVPFGEREIRAAIERLAAESALARA
jgi:alcohol dehydrogenase class IV